MRAAVRTIGVPPTYTALVRGARRRANAALRDRDIVERQHAIADLLVFLVALAGDEHEVAGRACDTAWSIASPRSTIEHHVHVRARHERPA